jgi:hypothetical protein
LNFGFGVADDAEIFVNEKDKMSREINNFLIFFPPDFPNRVD